MFRLDTRQNVLIIKVMRCRNMLPGKAVESSPSEVFKKIVTFFQKWHNNPDSALGQEIDWIVSSGLIFDAQPPYFPYLQAVSVLGACNCTYTDLH